MRRHGDGVVRRFQRLGLAGWARSVRSRGEGAPRRARRLANGPLAGVAALGLLSGTLALVSGAAQAATCPLPGSEVVGNFEIDGNIAVDCPPNIDWNSPSVAPQPAVADPIGAADTSVFSGGSELDTPTSGPHEWQLGGNFGGSGAKYDIGYVFQYSQVYNNQDLAYFGFERAGSNGTTYFGIELNQLPDITNSNGVQVPQRSNGDLLIVVTQQGNGVFSISDTVYQYSGGAYAPCPGCNPPGAITGAVNTSPIAPLDAADPIAVANGGTIPANQFAELGFNLSALNGAGTCATPAFTTFNAFSLASNSTSAEMKDYIQPQTINIPSTCAALKILKENANGQPVPGATFTITPDPIVGSVAPSLTVTDGGANDPDGTANGIIYFSQAKPGVTYTVTETAAPTGYLLPSTVAQTKLAPGSQTTTFTFIDPLGQASWLKVDGGAHGAGTTPLCGATFTLTATAGPAATILTTPLTVTDNCGQPAYVGLDTDARAGYFTVKNLYAGTYQLAETTPPTGYTASTATPSFTIDQTHQSIDLTSTPFVDDRILSQLFVQKTDSSGTPLTGASFDLYQEKTVGTEDPATDTNIGSCTTTGASGECSIGSLDFGTYYWKETAAPPGYNLPATTLSSPITIDAANAGTTLTVTKFQDPQILSEIDVTKVDASTGADLAGAVFGLRTTALGADITTCTTPANGLCKFTGLAFGTYYVVEETAPPGYSLPATTTFGPYTFSAANAGTTVSFTVKDPQGLSEIDVTKTDATTGADLAGAVFGLRNTAGGADIANCTTAANGVCKFTALGFGTYYVVEETPPTGYSLPATTTFGPFVINAPTTVKVPVQDPQILSEIDVTKTDATTGADLAGAVFGLRNTAAGADITTCTTPANGLCKFTGLVFGTYYVVEETPPTGYSLPATTTFGPYTFDAANAGTTVSFTVKDPEGLSEIDVTKVDASTGADLAGAVFGLRNTAGGADITKCTTPVGGVCKFTGLAFGTYFVVEETPPPGYSLPTTTTFGPYTFDAKNAGTTVAVTVRDTAIPPPPPPGPVKADPSITTVAIPNTGVAGVALSNVGDTATLHNVSANGITGSVTFTLYSDSACTVPVPGMSGSGAISTSGGTSTASWSASTWAPPAPGVYYWLASYPGDANNSGFTTNCGDPGEEFTATPPPTTAASPYLSGSKTSSPPTGSTVSPGQTVTYGLLLTNVGSAVASAITETDTVPAGTTYVAGSATCGGVPTCTVTVVNGLITWAGIVVPAFSGGSAGTVSLSFQVTVDSNDTDTQVIPNHALFTNANTPGCTDPTCPTNTVTLTVSAPVVVTQPASNPKPITAATTVHTGKPWAGSRPLELLVGLMGMALVALGLLRRRQYRTRKAGSSS